MTTHWSPAVQEAVAGLKAAVDAGKLRAVEQVWSPADTTDDTRYKVRLNSKDSVIIFHREVAGFLSGLGKS